MKSRDAAVADASAIARIYNEGIDDRVATFETRHRTADDVVQWLDGRHPVVVVEGDSGEVIAFAATSAYRPRDCYAGIAEFSVYAARPARGRGAGRLAMEALVTAAREAGFWKLVSRVLSRTPPAGRYCVPPASVRPASTKNMACWTVCGGMW
jgi:L-amino acid N-acyltransferase YncA